MKRKRERERERERKKKSIIGKYLKVADLAIFFHNIVFDIKICKENSERY
jgi:hypothetical protein